MPSFAELLQNLQLNLQQVYDDDEALAIGELVLEELNGWNRSQWRLHRNETVPNEQVEQIQSIQSRLLTGEPVQYILGHAWFMGEKYQVGPGVLIPRPETEELVDWISKSYQNQTPKRIIDIGTGSGCLAIALSNVFPQAEVWGVDISADALRIAQKNTEQLHSNAQFKQVDILDSDQWDALGQFDLVVSNPPYITEAEKLAMHQNVMQHEPHTALFVSDADPLLFYRSIARFGLQAMQPGGQLFYEINANFGQEMLSLMASLNYSSLELRNDMQGKERMLRAHR
ncbi:MAG: peptide chain release factor N(5)-glutamine methyltransferase [Bacteroidetes bacterium]|nr:MAG: peptide chain release factor N(5)-glutamine methyltransferase [Bacteroidota bacterium]